MYCVFEQNLIIVLAADGIYIEQNVKFITYFIILIT